MHGVPYMRFQGTVRHPRGHFPGVFVLTNELAHQGRLTEDQHRFWRANNDWYDAHYPNPIHVDPEVYDRETPQAPWPGSSLRRTTSSCGWTAT